MQIDQMLTHLRAVHQMIGVTISDLEKMQSAPPPFAEPVAKTKKKGRPSATDGLVKPAADPEWFADEAHHLTSKGRQQLLAYFEQGLSCSQAAFMMGITDSGARPHFDSWKLLKTTSKAS